MFQTRFGMGVTSGLSPVFILLFVVLWSAILAIASPRPSDLGIAEPLRLLDLDDSPIGASMEVAKLYGSIDAYAYYFVDILVGLPPQRQSVILDSGSSLLAFPCAECDSCGTHIDSPFDYSLSTTFEWLSCESDQCFSGCGRDNHCPYTQSYSEGSTIAGNYFKDIVALGDVERNNSFVEYNHIGCHTKETKLFTTQKANGIMGVSYPKGGVQTTIMDVLFGDTKHDGSSVKGAKKGGSTNTRVFAVCLADNGGILTVGGFDSSLHIPGGSHGGVTRRLLTDDGAGSTPRFLSDHGVRLSDLDNPAIESDPTVRIMGDSDVPIAWAQVRSPSSYTIKITEMRFNGRKIATGEHEFGPTVVDSGTTYSYFPPPVFSAISDELDFVCRSDSRCSMSGKGRACWSLKDGLSEMDDIPKFTFITVGGAVVEWGPRSYLYKGRRGWCSAIDDNRSATSLLGMSFMKNKNIIFDRERDRIGFVDADCPAQSAQSRPQPPTKEAFQAAHNRPSSSASKVIEGIAEGGDEQRDSGDLSEANGNSGDLSEGVLIADPNNSIKGEEKDRDESVLIPVNDSNVIPVPQQGDKAHNAAGGDSIPLGGEQDGKEKTNIQNFDMIVKSAPPVGPPIFDSSLSEVRVETPKVSEVKVETPKVSEVKVETPKVSEVKGETPKVSEVKGETPKVSEVKGETPKVSEVKGETPNETENNNDEAIDEEGNAAGFKKHPGLIIFIALCVSVPVLLLGAFVWSKITTKHPRYQNVEENYLDEEDGARRARPSLYPGEVEINTV